MRLAIWTHDRGDTIRRGAETLASPFSASLVAQALARMTFALFNSDCDSLYYIFREMKMKHQALQRDVPLL